MASDADADIDPLSSDNFLRILRINDGSDEEEEGSERRDRLMEQEEREKELNGEQRQEEEAVGRPGLQQQQEVRLSSIDTTLLIRHVPSRGLSFQIWPAAATMVSLLDRDPALLLLPIDKPPPQHQLRVLELGSGTGLVGIAVAAALGARVIVTDLPHVVSNLQHNAHANADAVAARGGEVVARQLRWGDEQDAEATMAAAGGGGGDDGGTGFDLVLGSDVVYYEHLIDPLLQTLRQVVRGDGTAFVMAHLRRWKRRDALFFRKARKVFDVDVLHEDPPLPEWRSGVVVYRFVEKKKKQQQQEGIRWARLPKQGS